MGSRSQHQGANCQGSDPTISYVFRFGTGLSMSRIQDSRAEPDYFDTSSRTPITCELSRFADRRFHCGWTATSALHVGHTHLDPAVWVTGAGRRHRIHMPEDVPLERLASVVDVVRRQSTQQAALVALTGIDGCGKGFVTARLTRALEARGHRVASLNVDGWLNLPTTRFSDHDPAEHFYRHAIRFEDMFEQLVLPLRDNGSVQVEAQFVEETAVQYRPHVYAFAEIDIILLEGIYLLKRDLRSHYDLSIWIDCSFETALARAVARAQESLPPDATVRAYRTIYFPAQSIHFARDAPRAAARFVVMNDPGLGKMVGADE